MRSQYRRSGIAVALVPRAPSSVSLLDQRKGGVPQWPPSPRSLREISAELAARGFVAERTGRPYQAAQVSRMLAEDK